MDPGELLTRLARLVPGVVYQYRLWPDGRSAFPYSSPGMVDIYEVTPEEVREDATAVFGRLHPDDVAKVSEDIFESARTLETFYADFRVILPRQGLRWRWSQAVPERLADGGTLWHGIILDNTERKLAELEAERLQAQLLQAQKMESVGRLAGGVAHDFNNMLGVILGNVELALGAIAPDDPVGVELQEIQAAARRSADLTRQLLSFARRQPIVPETLDLNEVVPETLVLLERLIGEHIELSWVPGPELWPARIDRTQVDQVLTNLCVNARDAILGVGSITIATSNRTLDAAACAGIPDATAGDYVCLSVADTGAGMDRETMSRIFEPFYTTKDIGEGTGLGLSTVYGSVRQNDGFIAVSSAPGRGSVFEVLLPRVVERPEAGGAAAKRYRRDWRGRETILLVEDEPALLRLVDRVLREQGYDLLAAGTPAEAARLAAERAGEIDLLLTDVVMPGMSGPELADRIATTNPGMRVLYMSGYLGGTDATRPAAGRVPYLIEKPFQVGDLLAGVREALDDA